MLCVELIGHRPARSFGGKSKSLLLVYPIHFEHGAVGRHREVLAFGIPKAQKVLEFVGPSALLGPTLRARWNRETPFGQLIQCARVGSKRTVVGIRRVGKHAQAALGYFSGILHF